MDSLKRVRSILEFHEVDKDQGVERTYLYYKNDSLHLHTDKQGVDLIESPVWGKMLFLDGVLQSTQKDEVIYHNALVHPLMSTLDKKENILILGGGEGATAREVLRWNVNTVRMVDYDSELVHHMMIHGGEWHQKSFIDPRLKLTYDDAWEFMKSAPEYDGVIIDLTDPHLTKQKWLPLLEMVLESVKKSKGGFVMNAGLYVPWKIDQLYEIKNMIEGLCSRNPDFKYYIYTTFIPSFNGEWTFIVVSHKVKFMIEPEFSDVIPAWIKRGIKMLPDVLIENQVTTKPEMHRLS